MNTKSEFRIKLAIEGFNRPATFKVWQYYTGHRSLLIRSLAGSEAGRNIDLMFSDVKYMELPGTEMVGIRLDTPTQDELQAATVRSGFDIKQGSEEYYRNRTYVLCTTDRMGKEQRYIVVAGFFEIEENNLESYETNL